MLFLSVKQFESEMTPAEKEKMYKAIGYQENAAPAIFPKTFVAYSIAFLLRTLEIELRDDDSDVKTVLLTNLSGVGIKLEHRPGGQAIKYENTSLKKSWINIFFLGRT